MFKRGAKIIKQIFSKFGFAVVCIGALITIIILMAAARIPELSAAKFPDITISESDGAYDLQNVIFPADNAVSLTAGDKYWANALVTPETIDSVPPASVSDYEKIGAQYLSQRFRILVPDDTRVYRFRYTLSGQHGIRAYVNGRLAAEQGIPATTKAETQIYEDELVFYASADDGRIDIILQNSQFFHSSKIAYLGGLRVSDAKNPDPDDTGDVVRGLIVMGGLACAGLFIGIVMLLQPDKPLANLYFMLACFAMAMREGIMSRAWTVFPISGNTAFMLKYLSMSLLTVFLTLFLAQSLTSPFFKALKLIALTSGIAYGAITFFGDSIWYTKILIAFQIVLVACIFLLICGLCIKLRRPNAEEGVFLYGILVFFIAAVSDILMYIKLIRPFGVKEPIAEDSMLIFAVAEIVYLTLMNHRITSHSNEVRQKLAAQKEALEQLDSMKTRFLGNISHELKTPLTVISGHAQSANERLQHTERFDKDILCKKMKIISAEAERLSLMVGQLLDFTRIEESKFSTAPVPCYADEIVQSAVEAYFPVLNKNENRLKISIDADCPQIYADPYRIAQVMVNLVANASRFTEKGDITITVKKDEGFAAITVSDTGKGIEPERIPYIFQRYSGSDVILNNGTSTGLGLYICRRIAEENGGSISVQSVFGEGSAFTLRIPLYNENNVCESH